MTTLRMSAQTVGFLLLAVTVGMFGAYLGSVACQIGAVP